MLVAEDHPLNQQVARAMAESAGCTVRVVDDGAQAVAAVAAGGIDLVLMDVMMPVLDGIDATRAIRHAEHRLGRPRVPILALTAVVAERARCLEAGMDEFLAKPIAPLALWTALAARLPAGAPEDDAIDRAQFDQLLVLDTRRPGFVAELVGKFLASLPGQVERIRRAIDAGDVSGARATAHQLGSSSGYLGAQRLQRAARAIEQAAHRSDDAVMRRHLTTLERDAPTTVAQLKSAARLPDG